MIDILKQVEWNVKHKTISWILFIWMSRLGSFGEFGIVLPEMEG